MYINIKYELRAWVTCGLPKLNLTPTPGGGGGYSLYLDDRDDRRYVEIGDLVFFRGCPSEIL